MVEVELPDPQDLDRQRDRAWTRRVALVTAVYAVVLAIASLGGNNAMKEMLLAQQEATNQWAYYQAKVVREHVNRAHKLTVQAMLAEPSSLPAAQRPAWETLARTFGDEERRMAADKREIEKEARRVEALRNLNQSRDPYFDYAEVLLQIAIVTASVAILSNSRPVFWFSLVLAVGGGLLTANGFTLAVEVPFLRAS